MLHARQAVDQGSGVVTHTGGFHLPDRSLHLLTHQPAKAVVERVKCLDEARHAKTEKTQTSWLQKYAEWEDLFYRAGLCRDCAKRLTTRRAQERQICGACFGKRNRRAT